MGNVLIPLCGTSKCVIYFKIFQLGKPPFLTWWNCMCYKLTFAGRIFLYFLTCLYAGIFSVWTATYYVCILVFLPRLLSALNLCKTLKKSFFLCHGIVSSIRRLNPLPRPLWAMTSRFGESRRSSAILGSFFSSLDPFRFVVFPLLLPPCSYVSPFPVK